MTTTHIKKRPVTGPHHSVYETSVTSLENELRSKIEHEALVGVPNLALFLERTEQYVATAYQQRADELSTRAPSGLRHLLREITTTNRRERRCHIHALTYREWTNEQVTWTFAQHLAEQQLCLRRYLAIGVLPCRYCAGHSVTSPNQMPAREVISEYGDPVYRLACGHNTFKEAHLSLSV